MPKTPEIPEELPLAGVKEAESPASDGEGVEVALRGGSESPSRTCEFIPGLPMISPGTIGFPRAWSRGAGDGVY